jgi:hypothetical protein
VKRFFQSKWGVALLVFLAALLPRVLGLTWGLPSREHWFSFHPDERQIAEAVLQLDPLNGDLNPNFFNYPSLFVYLAWLSHLISTGLGLSTPLDPSAPWPFLRDITLSARFACALMGTVTAPLVFLWLRPVLFRWAVVAALLVAWSPGLVQHSHFATVDVPATFFVVLCLWLTRRAQTTHPKYLAWAAFAAGLAAATKYNAVIVAAAPLVAALALEDKAARAKYLGLGCVLPVAGFLLGCPHSVLSFAEFWGSTDSNLQQGFAYELLTHPRQGSGEVFQGTSIGWLYHLTFNLPFAMTAWIVVLLFAAVILSFGLQRVQRAMQPGFVDAGLKYLWPSFAFAALYFVAIGTSQVKFLRYLLPIVPPLCALLLFSLRSLADGGGITSGRPRQGLAALLLAIALWGTRDVVYPFLQTDSRDASVTWLLSQSGSEIQTIALPEKLWFYSPPLLPQNAPLGNFSLPQTTNDGRFRVENFEFDAARLEREKPLWVAMSEFNWREKERLRDAKYLQWASVLQRDYALAWQKKNVAPLPLPGRAFVPHDFLYVNPEVRIYKRRGATP